MNKVLGNGIYSLPEAARLIGKSRARIWAQFNGWPSRPTAVLQSDYAGMPGHHAISFLDLYEAIVCLTLRDRYHVTPKVIRKLRRIIGDRFGRVHPFARKDLYVDDTGRQIFVDVASKEESPELFEVLRHQYALTSVILPFLQHVEYNSETHLAEVLPLMGRVVLDPRRKYGTPTVRGTGMATSILFDCFSATRSIEEVADWYNVDTEDVVEAVAFETEFSGIAA